MPDDTTILSLPLILPAQAQKHVTHNEALVALDLIVQLAVINRTLTAPPALPSVGDRHIVASGATGEWAGQAGRIALYAETGWQFTAPLAGWRAHVLSEGATAVFDGLVWKAPSESPLSVSQLGVAATADAVNRLTVAAPATLLNHAGGGHQLKLNKAGPGDTASLLFQTGFSGRAEMGTAGSDDFSVKVSADGAVWATALEADAATGEVTLPQPVHLGGQAADPVTPPDGTLWLNTTTGEVRVRSGGVTLPVGGGGGGIGDGDKGDITVSGGGTVWNIDAGAVGLAEMANLPAGRIIGRATAGAGVPEALTGAEATALLEVFGSGAKGLVPASGGGTVNFLRADGSFAAPPALPPGGVSGDLQFNNGGVFGGAADAGIESGQLRLSVVATPTAPAAGGVKLFGRSFAGRAMPAFMGPAGLDSLLQPHFARNRIGLFLPPGNGTAAHVLGVLVQGIGTAATENVGDAGVYDRMKRVAYQVTTPSTSAVAGLRVTANQWTVGGGAAALGGFNVGWKWGPSTGVANGSHRAFCGMRPSAVPTDVNPSTLVNMCGMGWDAADAHVQFMHNDGSGAAVKIDLGASFPKPGADKSDVYECALFSPPGTTQSVSYEVTNLTTGAVATGTVTTDLPATNTFLAPMLQMSVGGVSSVVGLAVMGLYIESDF